MRINNMVYRIMLGAKPEMLEERNNHLRISVEMCVDHERLRSCGDIQVFANSQVGVRGVRLQHLWFVRFRWGIEGGKHSVQSAYRLSSDLLCATRYGI